MRDAIKLFMMIKDFEKKKRKARQANRDLVFALQAARHAQLRLKSALERSDIDTNTIQDILDK